MNRHMDNRLRSAEKSMDTWSHTCASHLGGGIRYVRATARRLALLSCLLVLSWPAAAVSMLDVHYTALPGGAFEAELVFDVPPPEPRGYSIEKPARISLDLT